MEEITTTEQDLSEEQLAAITGACGDCKADMETVKHYRKQAIDCHEDAIEWYNSIKPHHTNDIIDERLAKHAQSIREMKEYSDRANALQAEVKDRGHGYGH